MYNNYKQRETELNDIKRLANEVLEENLKHNKIAVGWQKRVVEKNIFNLKNIIQDINIDLREENLRKYVDAFQYNDVIDLVTKNTFSSSQNHFINFREIVAQISSFNTIPNIAFHSKFATIDTDVNWAMHPTVKELTDICINKQSPEILEKYIPDAIRTLISTLDEYVSINIDLNDIVEVILGAIKLSEDKQYVGSNIILITCLESISLKLIEFAYARQNPGLSRDEIQYTVFEKFGSLYKLVTQIDLKPDIPITYLDASIFYKHSSDAQIIKMTKQFHQLLRVEKEARRTIEKIYLLSENMDTEQTSETEIQAKMEEIKSMVIKIQDKMNLCEIKSIHEKSLIALNVQLEFLTKRIYEERNLIVHGQFYRIENNWKNYMYLVAVIRLFEICKDYEQIKLGGLI